MFKSGAGDAAGAGPSEVDLGSSPSWRYVARRRGIVIVMMMDDDGRPREETPRRFEVDDGGRRACARDDACANARVRIKEISLYILTRRSRARRRVNAA